MAKERLMQRLASKFALGIMPALVIGTFLDASFAQQATQRPPSAASKAEANQTPPKAAQGPDDPDDPAGNDVDLYTQARQIEGHVVWLRVRSPDADKARKALDSAASEIGRVYRKFNVKSRSSEIWGINHAAATEEVQVSTETESLLGVALRLCRISEGGFDPTHHSFSYLWNLDHSPFVPPLASEIAARQKLIGCDKLAQKPRRGVRLTTAGTRISLDELLAGHALQRAGQAIEKIGVGSYSLRVDQHRYVMGRNKTRYWYTPVFHPLRRDAEMMQLYVGSHAIAVRYAQERSKVSRGVTFHDVIDPTTGRPARGTLMAVVIGTDPVVADAMSRALVALGPKRGLTMLGKITESLEGLVIDEAGVVHASPGMRNYAPKLPSRIPVRFDN